MFLQEIFIERSDSIASEIVVALSGQNSSQALYFENSVFRIEQLTMLFAVQHQQHLSSCSFQNLFLAIRNKLMQNCSW